MKLTIELDREVDGRWIAGVPELNVLLNGDSKQAAIQRAPSAAREIVLDRIGHGELPHEFLAYDSEGPHLRASLRNLIDGSGISLGNVSIGSFIGIEKGLDLIDSSGGVVVTNLNESTGVLRCEQQVTH